MNNMSPKGDSTIGPYRENCKSPDQQNGGFPNEHQQLVPRTDSAGGPTRFWTTILAGLGERSPQPLVWPHLSRPRRAPGTTEVGEVQSA